MPYANNKGTDQPAHLRSQLSAFVVCCLDFKTPVLAKSEKLASLCNWADRFDYYQVANPEDTFSRDVAHIGR